MKIINYWIINVRLETDTGGKSDRLKRDDKCNKHLLFPWYGNSRHPFFTYVFLLIMELLKIWAYCRISSKVDSYNCHWISKE